MKFRKLTGFVGVLCLFILPVTASAITLDISFENSFSQYYVTYFDGETTNNMNAYAGSFVGYDTESDFVTDVYCIELLQSISNETYDFDVYQLEDIEQRFQRAGWLMYTFSDLTGTEDSGALQLAIWEVTHESDDNGFDPYSGDFYVNSNNTVLDAIIASYNSATDEDFTSFDMGMFATYTSDDVQDLIGLNPTPTPEPGTMLLFGSGILGMGYLRLKRKKKQ